MDDDALLSRRTWRWLQVRISGLLDHPPTWVSYGDGQLTAVHATRLGYALHPPEFK